MIISLFLKQFKKEKNDHQKLDKRKTLQFLRCQLQIFYASFLYPKTPVYQFAAKNKPFSNAELTLFPSRDLTSFFYKCAKNQKLHILRFLRYLDNQVRLRNG